MSLERAGILLCCLFVLLAVVGCIVQYEERKKRRYSYRPTHDNRFPHRDEFRAFMRDCK